MRSLACAVLLAACSDPATTATDAPVGPGSDSASTITLDPTQGTYRQACDGSGGVALDFTHFLVLADDDQMLRVYTRGADAAPTPMFDINAGISLAADDEADLEDAARVGDRIYVIASHGRKKDGSIDPARYRFFALDVVGTSFTPVGPATTLMQDMLDTANWDMPNSAVIGALASAAQLGQATEPDLAPEVNGTNIEGLAAANGRLWIGFRNPQSSSKAIVVSLTNADAVLSGAKGHFGQAVELDLGGLGIRSMTWSPLLHSVLLIAGPHDGSGAFRLYKWSGAAPDAPVKLQDLASTATSHPEAVIAYPGTKDVQLLYDAGDATIGSGTCKKAALADRKFTDAILHLE